MRDRVAFVDHPMATDTRGGVAVVDREGAKTSLSDGWVDIGGLAWSPDGREVWFTASREGPSRGLHAATLDGRTRTLARLPGQLVLQDIHAAGYSATTTRHLFLRANTIHTLVVLDNEDGLRIHSLEDAVGSRAMPIGGAATGLGGTAPTPGTSPALWLAIMAGGGLLAAMGAIRLRRRRHRAAHAAIDR
jgi:hypothetical protein